MGDTSIEAAAGLRADDVDDAAAEGLRADDVDDAAAAALRADDVAATNDAEVEAANDAEAEAATAEGADEVVEAVVRRQLQGPLPLVWPSSWPPFPFPSF